MLAQRDAEISARIASIAFLGTPFLETRPRSLDLLCQNISASSSWFLLIFGPLLVAPLAVAVSVVLLDFPHGLEVWQGVLFFGLGLSLWLFAVALYLVKRPALRREIERATRRYFAARQRLIACYLRLSTPSCPIFVARVARDEARVWLRFVNLLADAPWIVISLGQRALGAIILTSIASLFGAAFATSIFGLPDDAVASVAMTLLGVAALLALVLLIAPIPFAIFLWLVRGTRFGIGDGLIEGLAANLRIASVPQLPHALQSEIVAPPGDGQGLRHSSFYGDADLAEKLSQWLVQIQPSSTMEPASSIGQHIDKAVNPDLPPLSAKLIIPGLASLAVILATTAMIVRSVNAIDLVASDIDPSPPNLKDGEWTNFEPEIYTVSSSANDNGSVVDLKDIKGAECEFRGTFKASNWVTTIEFEQLSFKETTRADWETAAMFEVEEAEGKYYRYFDQSKLWSLSTATAKSVKFSKSFIVKADWLHYSIMNESIMDSSVNLTLSYRCA